MKRVCSIFSQVLQLIPRDRFEAEVKKHQAERHARGFTSWGQLVAMLFCQLGQAKSLREITEGLQASEGKLKHLGLPEAPARSTLAYANSHRPWQLFEAVFHGLLGDCRKRLGVAKAGARLTLTDLYPQPTSAACSTPSIDYWSEPVSAARVPPQLQGLRSLFVNHFTPPLARAVLQDAFRQRQSICIFEATSRTGSAIAASFLIPAMVLLLTPSVRPITMYQIVFTYLIPVIPLLAVWDGLVSQLRTYSIAELKELAADFTAPEYEWGFGLIEAKGIPYKTCYLIGRPRLVE